MPIKYADELTILPQKKEVEVVEPVLTPEQRLGAEVVALKAITERQRIELEKAEYKLRQERLKRFIARKGGKITFAEFMQESLYGRKGPSFYNAVAQIGVIDIKETEGNSFSTYSGNPIFSELMVRFALANSQLGTRFLELAGGAGAFKQGFFAELARLEQPEALSYLSLDIADKLVKAQSQLSLPVVQGSALELPLASSSVAGVIFGNELVDALPFTMVRVQNPTGRKFKGFKELYYVLTKDDQIEPKWLPLTKKSRNYEAVWRYWQRQSKLVHEQDVDIDFDLPNERIMAIPLYDETFIKELFRVLSSGHVVLFDYGQSAYNTIAHSRAASMRMYPKSISRNIYEAFEVVYQADITVNVNFSVLIDIAKELGFEIVEYTTQRRFFDGLLSRQEHRSLRTMGKRHRWFPYRGLLMREKNDFKVLVLKK